MSERPASVPPRRVFAGALFTGLVWGVIAAVLFSSLIMTVLAYSSNTSAPAAAALDTLVMTFWWMTAFACAAAVFPIGPAAALLGWRLYRAGVVSPLAYAAVGAVSTLTAPILIIVFAAVTAQSPTANYAVVNDGVVLILVAGFAVVGAFGGYVAGRTIRRAAAEA